MKRLTKKQQKLVLDNLHRADLRARWWKTKERQIPLEDLRQEALVGLIEAVPGFDKRIGKSVAAYAHRFMDGAIIRMRSKWYTGKQEGFEKDYPVPTWVLLDHPPEEDRHGDWRAAFVGSETNKPEMREQLIGIKPELMDPAKRQQQEEILRYLTITRERMKRKGITDSALAAHLRVSQPAVSRWLNNQAGLSKNRKRIDKAISQLTRRSSR